MERINPAKLNKINQNGAKVKMEKIEDKISAMIKKLKTRAEREVCEYGSFKIVKENLQSQNKESLLKE